MTIFRLILFFFTNQTIHLNVCPRAYNGSRLRGEREREREREMLQVQ